MRELVERVTRRLITHHKLYPMGVERQGQHPEYGRRYVCRPLVGSGTSCFSIGVRDSFAEWVTPIWMRFHKDTP